MAESAELRTWGEVVPETPGGEGGCGGGVKRWGLDAAALLEDPDTEIWVAAGGEGLGRARLVILRV